MFVVVVVLDLPIYPARKAIEDDDDHEDEDDLGGGIQTRRLED